MKYCPQTCFVNSPAFANALSTLLSWACKGPAILVFWKDFPWKPKNKSKKPKHKDSTENHFYSRPRHSHPGRRWLSPAPTKTPTFSLLWASKTISQAWPAGKAQPAQPESQWLWENSLEELKPYLYYPKWCVWLENLSGEMVWTESPLTSPLKLRGDVTMPLLEFLIGWHLVHEKRLRFSVAKGIKMTSPHWGSFIFSLLCSFHVLKTSYWSTEFPRWLGGKESTCKCKRHGFDPRPRKIRWRRKWQPTPVFSPGESQGQRSLTGYSPQCCKRDWHDLVTKQKHHHHVRAHLISNAVLVSGVQSTKWFSYTYTWIYSFSNYFPI